MADQTKETPLKKVMIIVAKGTIEDIYAGLVMANGAVMEGIETKLFFTFFGLDAVIKKRQNKSKTATVGNPAMRMPGGLPFPTLLGMLPGVEAGVSAMMKNQMLALDVPPVDEFIEMIDYVVQMTGNTDHVGIGTDMSLGTYPDHGSDPWGHPEIPNMASLGP